MSISDKVEQYLELSKELTGLRKRQTDLKKQLQLIEKGIWEYMRENEMENISSKTGEIVIYSRKVSQTYKRDIIAEKLAEELSDKKKADELADSIVKNKKFIVEEKIKAVIKKK